MVSGLLPALLIALAVLTVPIAALMPISKHRGRFRLAGSLLAGSGLIMGAVSSPMMHSRFLIPDALLIALGAFLLRAGVRKYRKDPTGITPAGKIL